MIGYALSWLHDTVGINWKNGATTDYHGADIEYMG